MGGRGSGGHNRKTVEELRLIGTFRRDRHGTPPAAPAADLRHPPAWLSGHGLKFWRRYGPALAKDGLLTVNNLLGFALLAVSIEIMETAWDDAAQGNGQARSLAIAASKEVDARLAKFGMTRRPPAWQR